MILDSIKIKNFKAVRDSGTVKLGPLTALIGHNGSGKSSLIEALETYQAIVTHGLDKAMQRFMGMEHVQNKSAEPDAGIPALICGCDAPLWKNAIEHDRSQ